LQGKISFTVEGRAAIGDFTATAGEGAQIDVAYFVRPSIAGLSTKRPDGEMFQVANNGSELERPVTVASTADGGAESGWFARNFGWLMAD